MERKAVEYSAGRTLRGFGLVVCAQGLRVREVSDVAKAKGIAAGDVMVEMDHEIAPPNTAAVAGAIADGKATHFVFLPDSSPIVSLTSYDYDFGALRIVVALLLLAGAAVCASHPDSSIMNCGKSLAGDCFQKIAPDPVSAWAQPETVLQRMLCTGEEACVYNFFQKSWEKKLVYWPRGNSQHRFHELCKCTELRGFLMGLVATETEYRGSRARNELDVRVTNNRYEDYKLFTRRLSFARSDFIFPEGGMEGVLNEEFLAEAFDTGYSIVVNHLMYRTHAVAAYAHALEANMRMTVNINLYHSPTGTFLCTRTSKLMHAFSHTCVVLCAVVGSGAFGIHYDQRETFVLQLRGRKHWKVFAPVTDGLHNARLFDKGFDEHKLMAMTQAKGAPPPIFDAVLGEGDRLYIPRGYPHYAKLVSPSSCHISVSLHSRLYQIWEGAFYIALQLWNESIGGKGKGILWMHAGMRNLANSRPELRHTIMQLIEAGSGTKSDANTKTWAAKVQEVVCSISSRGILVSVPSMPYI
jgi:hypothetical protein